MIYKRVLENGIRVVTEKIPFVNSVAIGLWVRIGSRDEESAEHGISHFLEHMFFKGTAQRSAKEIALEIDGIGGELNAFTGRETTTFYAKVLDAHLPKAIDILSDNLLFSQFDPVEIDRERQVVLEEIKMVEDDPEDWVHDLHVRNVWKGNLLARAILGTPETVSAMTRENILHFIQRTYDPHEMVIAVAGRFTMSALMRQLHSSFGKFSAKAPCIHPRIPPKIHSIRQIKKKAFEQVHLCVGTPGLAHTDPDRYALYILNALFGGGMSSRLYQEIREQRGWVYSIYSAPQTYQDAGLFTIYAGTRPANAGKVVDLVLKELKKMKEGPIASDELARAKDNIKGGMLLGMESTSNRMCRLAKEELYFGRHFPLEETLEEIDKVSAKQVSRLANQLFDSKYLSLTALGRIDAKAFPQTLSL